MERPVQETKLFFREGTPVFATSTRDELRLGNMLVRQNRVEKDRMESLLMRQRSGTHRLGQLLLEEHLLSEAELSSFLKVQVSEVIFETFEWREGVFTFWDKVAPPGTAVTLEMELQNLLMEGVRRSDERERLREVFPDLERVVEAVANPERVKQSVTLTPEEWKTFFLVDGRRTLGEICRLAGNPDELATLQILHNLLRANFVTLGRATEGEPIPEVPAVPAAEPHSTQHLQDGKPAAPMGPVSVAFSPVVPVRPPEDDTKEVVTKSAVPYMGAAPAPRLTVSRLLLLEEGQERSFPLTGDSYTVGRHKNNDIVINDAKVSSFHARLDRSAEGFTLVDLKSRNGCYINGQRTETALLKTGDELRLGAARLQYRVDFQSIVK
jgi:hypothetical protein